MATCTDAVIDMTKEWPEIYNKVKDTSWFKNLVQFYYQSAGGTPTQELPISQAWQCEEDEDTKLLICSSPADARWWIVPHECTLINGLFLYIVLKKLGINVQIVEGDNHVYLRDENRKIYDLYWVPLGYHHQGYHPGITIDAGNFWDKYDLYRFMQEAGLLELIAREPHAITIESKYLPPNAMCTDIKKNIANANIIEKYMQLSARQVEECIPYVLMRVRGLTDLPTASMMLQYLLTMWQESTGKHTSLTFPLKM